MTTDEAICEIIASNYGEAQCHEETMKMACEALREKQERENKEPLIAYVEQRTRGIPLTNKTFTEPKCSACKHRIEDLSAPYCAYCGRLLKGKSNGTLDWLKAETEGTE